MSEKGYQFAEVTHKIKELPGGPKLVHLTFNIKEGPKVKIKQHRLRSATRRSATASSTSR